MAACLQKEHGAAELPSASTAVHRMLQVHAHGCSGSKRLLLVELLGCLTLLADCKTHSVAGDLENGECVEWHSGKCDGCSQVAACLSMIAAC